MTMLASRLLGCFALALGMIAPPMLADAQDLDDLPVGTVQNFGPNLQTAAGGICRQPEGLAIDPDGNLYAASNSDAATTVGFVCVINNQGELVDTIAIPAGPGAAAVGLLGELWEDDALYVLDQADNIPPHGRILKINPRTHEVTTIANGLAFPNGMAEDRHGHIFVTDSLLATIYRFTEGSSDVEVWFKNDALLSHNQAQNVGANDLAFDADEHFLFVDNAGDRRVFRIRIDEDGNPDGIQLFADGATLDKKLHLPSPTALFFADGMQFDVKGNLYVMANMTDEIEVFDPDGELIHRFAGTGVNALDFNASPVFKGHFMFITNMSAVDGGVNSKLSVFVAPNRGLRLN